jgi:hypothetical protein
VEDREKVAKLTTAAVKVCTDLLLVNHARKAEIFSASTDQRANVEGDDEGGPLYGEHRKERPMSDDNELAKLKKEIADLKQRIDPPPRPPSTYQPPDYTANASMSPDTMREFGKAAGGGVYGDVMRQGLERLKQAISAPTKPAPAHEPQPQRRGSGWRDEVPLGLPPGISHCDRMMDEQDKIDKAELALKLAKVRMGKVKDEKMGISNFTDDILARI